MTVYQLPSSFGLPEGPEFSMTLATMFVWYWSSLADFGITEDSYCFDSGGTSSNPFANFARCNTFMKETAVPYVLRYTGPGVRSSVRNTNLQLQNSPLPLIQTYTCSQRQRKGSPSLFISVVSADLALILGASNLFIAIVYIQKDGTEMSSKHLTNNGIVVESGDVEMDHLSTYADEGDGATDGIVEPAQVAEEAAGESGR
jgi:hypothetical protein